MSDERSLGELGRQLDRHIADTQAARAATDARMDRLVSEAVYARDREHAGEWQRQVAAQFTALEAAATKRTDRWLAVIGLVIALVSLVVTTIALTKGTG